MCAPYGRRLLALALLHAPYRMPRPFMAAPSVACQAYLVGGGVLATIENQNSNDNVSGL